uniref:HMG box domain-containing protein n=1 Tax=Plectus sambesii TaxID=2011161 RepID=A0A914VB89_9BILA
MPKVNAYSLFAQFMKPELERRAGRSLSFPECISRAAELWERLSPEERQEWKERAANDPQPVQKPNRPKPPSKKKSNNRVRVVLREGFESGDDGDADGQYSVLMTKNQKRLHDDFNVQEEKENALLSRYFDPSEFQLKRECDNNDALRKYVFRVPPNISIEDCRRRVLYYKHVVLHIVPHHYKQTAAHSLTPLEIGLAIFSAGEGFIKSKTWHLNWLSINPERATTMKNRTLYSTPHKLPAVFESGMVDTPRLYDDVKEVIEEMETMMEDCGGGCDGGAKGKGDILISGEMHNYNRIEGCLQTLREEYFRSVSNSPGIRYDATVLARDRLRCADSVLEAMRILTMEQKDLDKYPANNNVWDQHVLSKIVTEHKDKPNILRYCGYHGDPDHPERRPDRVSACALASAKLLAYHVMFDLARMNGMRGYIDINDPKYHPGGGMEGVADEVWRNPNYVDSEDPDNRALRQALKPPRLSVPIANNEYERLAEQDRLKDPKYRKELLCDSVVADARPQFQTAQQLHDALGNELEKRLTMKAEEEVRNVEPAYSVYGEEEWVGRGAVAPPVSAWVAAAAAPLLPPRQQPPSSSHKPKPTTLPPSVAAMLSRRRNDAAGLTNEPNERHKQLNGVDRG